MAVVFDTVVNKILFPKVTYVPNNSIDDKIIKEVLRKTKVVRR